MARGAGSILAPVVDYQSAPVVGFQLALAVDCQLAPAVGFQLAPAGDVQLVPVVGFQLAPAVGFQLRLVEVCLSPLAIDNGTALPLPFAKSATFPLSFLRCLPCPRHRANPPWAARIGTMGHRTIS